MTKTLLFLIIVLTCNANLPGQIPVPEAKDSRFSISLFASEPQVVTPTGIAVDQRGRVFCIESHTHFRPKNYQGPPADRIRIYEDSNQDGVADRIINYYEGSTATMNLAFAPDGSLYVATRDRIFRLEDRNGDDQPDSEKLIIDLRTEGNYPHNGLSGLSFLDDKLHFGFGENLGAEYQLVGTDGRVLSGGGEGGNIYRCNLDGSQLEQLATGFWNPFGLAFDRVGNLLAIDNDPDWRPPCRLIHVVSGGDYGYRFSHGRRGSHPFTGWFGELPGSLGMISGTGEAPSGILQYDGLGPMNSKSVSSHGNFLVTSWGLHSIELFHLRPQGASFVSTPTTVVKGGKDFRPVGIAKGPDGSIYVSDWCKRSYELHGHGRIWKVSVDASPRNRGKENQHITTLDEQLAKLTEYPYQSENQLLRELAANRFPDKSIDFGRAIQAATSPLERAALIRRSGSSLSPLLLVDFFNHPDPYIKQAARHALEKNVTPHWLAKIPLPSKAAQREGLALVMRRFSKQPEISKRIPELLQDEHPNIRLIALKWIGEERLSGFVTQLENEIGKRSMTGKLFESYLAALDMLLQNRRGAEYEKSEANIIARILDQAETPPETLVVALRKLQNITLRDTFENKHPGLSFDLLESLLTHADSRVARESVCTIRDIDSEESRELLLNIVRHRDRYPLIAADAVIGLNPERPEHRKLLLELVSKDNALATAAKQTLAGVKWTVEDKKVLKLGGVTVNSLIRNENRRSSGDNNEFQAISQRIRHSDANRGRLIFYNRRFGQCAKCHQVNGRGGLVGPDLSNLEGMTYRRLYESIVDPSQEIAPRHTPWLIQTYDGRSFTGVLVAERGDTQSYVDSNGKTYRVKFDEIEQKKAVSQSVMPQALLDRMSRQEVADLLLFLKKHPR